MSTRRLIYACWKQIKLRCGTRYQLSRNPFQEREKRQEPELSPRNVPFTRLRLRPQKQPLHSPRSIGYSLSTRTWIFQTNTLTRFRCIFLLSINIDSKTLQACLGPNSCPSHYCDSARDLLLIGNVCSKNKYRPGNWNNYFHNLQLLMRVSDAEIILYCPKSIKLSSIPQPELIWLES